MHGGARTGSITRSARTAGGGARLPVTAGSNNGGTRGFATEPRGRHVADQYLGRHAVIQRLTARSPYPQEHERALTASILYGRRKAQYGQHV